MPKSPKEHLWQHVPPATKETQKNESQDYYWGEAEDVRNVEKDIFDKTNSQDGLR